MTEYHYDTDTGRKYRYPGKAYGYPGVTSIINTSWPSDFLEIWRIGNIAKKTVENSEEVAKRLKRIAKKPPKVRELYAKGLQETFLSWKDDFRAANRGTRIHTGLERLYTGDKKKAIKDDMEPNEYAVVITAFEALRRMDFDMEYVEVPVYGHDPVKYAGTADFIGTFPKVMRGKTRRYRAVVDLKTGRRMYKNYIPQIAAYANANELITSNGEIIPMPGVTHGFILHATSKSAEFWQTDLEQGWLTFMACAQIYTAANTSKGMSKYE